MTKSSKSSRLKVVAAALVATLVVVVVAIYIIQVYEAPTTETTTSRTTETETETSTATVTATSAATIATTTVITETIPPVSLVWEKTHGGSEDDRAESIVESRAGHFIVAGRTKSFGAGGFDVYLLKIDSNGNKLWEKAYGGRGDDVGDCIVQSGDGGFIAAGWTTSFGAGHRDVYLLKIDGEGNKVWEKTFGGSSGDGAFSIVEAGEGEFVAAGLTASFGDGVVSAYLMKINGNGDKVWEKWYGGSGDAGANWIVRSGDGGFLVAGWTAPSDDSNSEVYLLKIDGDGNRVWEKTYGDGGDYRAYRIVQSGDGGFIVAGITNSSDAGDTDPYFLKVDANGNMIWEKAYGGSGDEEPWEIVETGDGEFIVVGWTESFGAEKMDAYLLKIRDNT